MADDHRCLADGRRLCDQRDQSSFRLPVGVALTRDTGWFAHKLPSSVCTKAAFLAAAARGKGLPSPCKVYGTVTEPLIWPADMPTGPYCTPRPNGPQAGRVTTQNTTDEHWRRRFAQCSQHMQKERAAELLHEAQGGLRSG